MNANRSDEGMSKPWLDRREIGPCVLYLGDCRTIVPHLDAPDLVYTSPPYLNQRTYGQASRPAWADLVPPALAAIPRHERTQYLVNLGLVRKKKVIRYWDDLIDHMEAAGVLLRDWYVWDKRVALPGDFNGRLCPQHEWLFHFGTSAVVLRKTIPCKTAGKSLGSTGTRNQAGKVRKRSSLLPSQSHKIMGSVVSAYPRFGSPTSDHPAEQCLEVPSLLLAAFAPRTVLDPFVGVGTTCVAALQQGIASVGIEIDPTHFETACTRIARAWQAVSEGAPLTPHSSPLTSL